MGAVYFKKFHKFSLFNAYFAFLDTDDYLADGLFIKHQVRVYFECEFVKPGNPYRVIFCHVRKWDEKRFCTAISALPNKMLLCGNVDYLDACAHIWERVLNLRNERRASNGAAGAAERAQ